VIAARIAAAHLHADRVVATTEHSNTASIGMVRRLDMDVQKNPDEPPGWFQTVGVIFDASLNEAESEIAGFGLRRSFVVTASVERGGFGRLKADSQAARPSCARRAQYQGAWDILLLSPDGRESC
jgi:hypothetical protein